MKRILLFVLLLGCGAERGPDGLVYFRTVPLSLAQSDSLRVAIMRQDFGVENMGSSGQPGDVRRGVILFRAGRADSTSRERVLAWLRGRPEIGAAGLDSAGVW